MEVCQYTGSEVHFSFLAELVAQDTTISVTNTPDSGSQIINTLTELIRRFGWA